MTYRQSMFSGGFDRVRQDYLQQNFVSERTLQLLHDCMENGAEIYVSETCWDLPHLWKGHSTRVTELPSL